MNIFKNKIKIILAISTVLIACTTTVFVYKKLTLPTQSIPQLEQSQSYNFSHPDNRPDEIKGKIVTLKRLKPEYFQDYHNMCLSPIVRKPLYLPTSFEQLKKILEKTLIKEAAGLILTYVIFDNKDNILIGEIAIREKSPKDPGQFYFWLNENYWGNGRIKEAFDLISKEYFKIYPNTPSFNVHVETFNLRSFYALKKCGFKLVDFYNKEGQLPRYILEFYNPNIEKKTEIKKAE